MTMREEFEAWMLEDVTRLHMSLNGAQWAAWQAAYAAGMTRAAEICVSEHLEDPTETNGDMAYDHAIRHCADAIRAEITKEKEHG